MEGAAKRRQQQRKRSMNVCMSSRTAHRSQSQSQSPAQQGGSGRGGINSASGVCPHSRPTAAKAPSIISGYCGVLANGKPRWQQAYICYGGKQRHLGTFDTKQQEAALAYD
jgi:hypothetical protein